jgi:hypothetical protein
VPVDLVAAMGNILPFMDVNFIIFDNLCMQLQNFCGTVVTSLYDNIIILVSDEELGI